MSNTGRFVWYELMTTDPAGAKAFYTELIGWKTEPFGADYTMWVGSQGPLGGFMLLPEQAKAMGAPSHWVGSVGVADVDATCALAKELGGMVYHGPIDIPGVGRYAVLGDPEGAVFAVFAPKGDMKPHEAGPGEVVWNELMAKDSEKALAWYGRLFGWVQGAAHDMGPMGTYRLVARVAGEKESVGMMTIPQGMPMPPAWCYYIHVTDLDGAIAKATSLGAKVLNGPMPIPDGTRIANLMDPQGAAFALHSGTPQTR